jgi:hypothetical protein
MAIYFSFYSPFYADIIKIINDIKHFTDLPSGGTKTALAAHSIIIRG